MEKIQLSIPETLKDAITVGIKNVPSLIGCAILYILTIWIPYINLGTTIAMCTIPIELSKGNVMSPLSIFDAKYRKYMGEFLLTQMFIGGGIGLAMVFLVIPGIVVMYSWSLALYFVLDKNMNPMEAIMKSNQATYGSKWSMFGVNFIFSLALIIVGCILVMIPYLGYLLLFVLLICAIAFALALQGSIYRQLKDNHE